MQTFQQSPKVVPEKDRQALFSNVSELLEISNSINQLFEKERNENGEITTVGNILLSKVSSFLGLLLD